MRIVTYNIQFGRGRDEVVDLDRIAREVAGADVICLQEVDRYWPRSGDVDQVAELMNRFPDYHAEYGAGVSIADDYPDGNRRMVRHRREFGNLTLCRYRISYVRHHLLPKYASTGPISIQRSALECVVDSPFGPLRLVNTHLTHLSSETRLPQVEKLLDIHRDGPLEGEPVCGDLEGGYWNLPVALPAAPRQSIFMGDFNMEPDSPEYTAMVGPWSEYGGRIGNPEMLVDAWTACGHDEEEGATADIHGRPVRLDYLFISPVLARHAQRCRIDTGASGSDHQPVWLDLADPT